MSIWLLITTLALASPESPLGCRLQPGAVWLTGERDVSAIVCGDRTGFFVPSLEFRALSPPGGAVAYRLLEEEHRLAKEELEALQRIIDADGVAIDRLTRALEAIEGVTYEVAETVEAVEAVEDDSLPGWVWFLVGGVTGLAGGFALGLAVD